MPISPWLTEISPPRGKDSGTYHILTGSLSPVAINQKTFATKYAVQDGQVLYFRILICVPRRLLLILWRPPIHRNGKESILYYAGYS